MNRIKTKLLLALFGLLPLLGSACEAFFEVSYPYGEGAPPYVHLENYSLTEGEEIIDVIWDVQLNGESIGYYFDWNLDLLIETDGVYEICLSVTQGDCETMHCEEIQIDPFVQWDCTLDIEVVEMNEETGMVLLEANPSDPSATVYWELYGNTHTGNPIELQFYGDFISYVAASFETPACPNGAFDGLDVWGNFPPECSDEIIIEATDDCYSYEFTANNGAFGNLIWDFSDGGGESSGISIGHTFPGPGTYTVCANFMSMECDGICIQIEVPECEGANCPNEIIVTETEDCFSYTYSLGNDYEGDVIWNFGDGTEEIAGSTITHTFPDVPEQYIICAEPLNADCESICVPQMVLPCNEDGCPLGMSYFIDSSGTFLFVLNGYEGNVLWDFGYNQVVEGNEIGSASLEWNGIQTICATPLDIECEPICIEVLVEWGNDPCDLTVDIDESDCGTYVLYANVPNTGNEVKWDLNGDWYGAGNVQTFQFTENGTYEICGIFENEDCEDLPYWCETIVVDCFGNECSDDIIIEETDDCYTYEFTANNQAFGNVLWDFSVGGAESSGTSITHTFPGPGTYTVCANFMSMECDGICIEIEVPECENNCELDVEVIQWSCNTYLFQANIPDGQGEAKFSVNDGDYISGNSFLCTFEENSNYAITALYDNPECNELLVWAYNLNVDCEEEECALNIDIEETDCGTFVLTADVPDNGNEVKWDLNGDWYGAGNIQTFSFEENGIYQICGVFENENCDLLPTWCETIVVNCDQNDCPEEIWSGEGDDCGVMLFEVGSFQDGESATWSFGDGSTAEGGHFITHQYDEAGEYVVTVSFSSDICEGVSLTTVVEVEDCEDDCTEVGFGFDSFVLSDGPEFIEYTLVDAFGNVHASGSAEYTPNEMYHDDWACLPDGCYEMIIEGSSTFENVEFYSMPFINGTAVPVFDVYYGENSMSYEFSINADCNPECTEFSLTVYNATGEDPFCTGYSLYQNGGGIVEYMGVEEASETNLYTYNFCLPDGCYEMVIDGNCEIVYGENFYVIGSPNVSIGEFEFIPLVAGNLPISVNGACGWDEACQPVQLTVDGDMVPGAVVEWLLESDEFELAGLLPLEALLNGEFTVDWCLPEECFTLTFTSDGPLPMDILLLELYAEELQQELGAFSMEFGEDYVEFEFGFSPECYTTIPEYEALNINVYPNPGSGLFNIEGDLSTMNRLEVYDMSGRLVHSANIASTQREQIDLSRLSIGLYQLNLMGESGVASSKIQILR